MFNKKHFAILLAGIALLSCITFSYAQTNYSKLSSVKPLPIAICPPAPVCPPIHNPHHVLVVNHQIINYYNTYEKNDIQLHC